MILRYGNYRFPYKVATPTVTSEKVYGPRGLPWAIRRQVRARFELNDERGTAAVAKMVDDCIKAHNADRGDLIWELPGGTSAPELSVRSSETVGGVRVVQPPSFTAGEGGEYSVYRKGEVAYEYMIPMSGVGRNFVWEWKEEVSFTGSGGAMKALTETKTGNVDRQRSRRNSICRATQSGTIVGLFQRPAMPRPLFPSDVDEERTQARLLPAEEILADGTELRFGIQYTYEFTSGTRFPGCPF